MDPEDEAPRRPAPSGWPPPHPSPPLPPPREYGTPGTPLDWRPWLWGSLATLVVVALVVVGLVVLLPGGDDDGGHAGQPETSPSATSASATSTASAPSAAYRCWDGAEAQTLEECSRPTGVEGLKWAFPAMADEKCGKVNKDGDDGSVVRVLCRHVLEDGTRIGIGYFQWGSVQDGKDFYGAQGLAETKAKGPGGEPVSFGFFGVQGDTVKSANLFVDEPLSSTVTFPVDVTPTAEDVQALAPRPFDQLRGAPVG